MLNGVGRSVVNDPGWWWGFCWRPEITGRDGLELRDVKRGMHWQGGGQLEANGSGEIPSGEPHLLPWLVLRSGDPMAISQSLTLPSGPHDGFLSCPPHLLTAGDVPLNRWDGDVSLLGREKGWLVAVSAHERRHPSSCADEGALRVLHPRKERGPGGGILGGDAAYGGLRVLVGPLCLPVGLRVVTRS